MNRIDDTTLSIALKLAAKASVDADVEMYKNLDVSDCEISERVKRKFRRNLIREFGRPKRQKIITAAKRVAIVCLVISSLSFISAMCIEPIRAAFVEAVVTWYENYIGFRFAHEEKMEYPSTIEKVYLPENLSDEWTVTKMYEYPEGVVHCLYGQNGEYVQLSQVVIGHGTLTVDHTNGIVTNIKLENGKTGYLTSYTSGIYELMWSDEYYFRINTENISLECLLEIANNLK